ncbi:hypothetical protein EVAR_34547_1 [Eumeta japonica]|uniref:Uncharacterized protein n=1 Tax=Eumeta variegata TaxID=151549 RepID=A0A4C1X8G4_EUMVA|nr:hypothetical protein EVAR_34547_1 [Eumeta japonica]
MRRRTPAKCELHSSYGSCVIDDSEISVRKSAARRAAGGGAGGARRQRWAHGEIVNLVCGRAYLNFGAGGARGAADKKVDRDQSFHVVRSFYSSLASSTSINRFEWLCADSS